MYLDRRLLALAHPERGALRLAVGLGLGAGLAAIAQAMLLAHVIAAAFVDAADGMALRGSLVWLVVAAMLRAAGGWGSRVVAAQAAGRIKRALRRRLRHKLLQLGPLGLTGDRSGELSSRAIEGVEALDAYFSQYLPQLALAALIPASIALTVLSQDLLSGVVLLVTAPLIPLFMYLIGQLARRMSRLQVRRLGQMSAVFLDAMQGMTTLKILGRVYDQVAVVARATEQFRHATLRVLRVAMLSALTLELLAMLSTAVIAVEVGLRLLYGRLGFEQALMVLLLAPELYGPLRLLGARFHAGVNGVEAADRVFALLERPGPLDGAATGALPVSAHPHVRLHDVSFSYPARDSKADGAPATPALHLVQLDLPPGKQVALVGPSGSGKSTLARLLLRLCDPQTGRITIDGEPLTTVDVGAWRERVTWVAEQPHLFDASVADNIRLARPAASDDEVVVAARAAQAHVFISELPQGYNTRVGERGLRLSGGEAQRVALARAFLKAAPIVILDEASAHLDVELEAALQQSTRELLRDRSAVVIAHRLSTIQSADEILVFDGGRVVERGTHQQLALRANGAYRALLDASGGYA